MRRSEKTYKHAPKDGELFLLGPPSFNLCHASDVAVLPYAPGKERLAVELYEDDFDLVARSSGYLTVSDLNEERYQRAF